jgi:hypothetical protein
MCGDAMANGEQRAVGATGGRGLPREPTDVVHRSQHARRTDHSTRAGLGVRVRRGTVAGRRGADDATRARLTPFEIQLALFEQSKL